ncbi:MAG TPA: hypothetical protein VHX44_07595, partial [Planctomycetota bacterium]|nr:hypothetical protein [Planctomycetota bacterium]
MQQRAAAALEITELEQGLDLGSKRSVRDALVRAKTLVRNHPDLERAASLIERLTAVDDSFAAQQLLERHRELLRLLHRHYRMGGPWPGEIEDITQALTVVGYDLTTDHHRLSERLKNDRLCTDVLQTIAQLQRALIMCNARDPVRAMFSGLIHAAAPTLAWAALGDFLDRTTL